MANIPMPLNDPIARPRRRGAKPTERDENEGKLTETWIPYLQSQNTITSTAIQQTTSPLELTGQAASIGLTSIPTPSLAGGLYRLTFTARITTPASVSSSLIVSFTWTDGGVAISVSSPAITGNLTSSIGTGTALAHIDGASPLSYSTTYVSVGTAMAYQLYIVVEGLNG